MSGCVIVRVFETVPCYGGGSYELEVMGFGEPTEEGAKARAAEVLAKLDAKPFYVGPDKTATRSHRAEFLVRCGACPEKMGVKTGCKRKACPACGGGGTVLLGAAASVVGGGVS